MITDIHSIDDTIVAQIKQFWPNRLGDYKAGAISVRVQVIRTSSDAEWLDKLKKESNITDPSCGLMMGFNSAILFLSLPMVDPL